MGSSLPALSYGDSFQPHEMRSLDARLREMVDWRLVVPIESVFGHRSALRGHAAVLQGMILENLNGRLATIIDFLPGANAGDANGLNGRTDMYHIQIDANDNDDVEPGTRYVHAQVAYENLILDGEMKSTQEEEECSICCRPLDDGRLRVKVGGCSHEFHLQCIRHWAEQAQIETPPRCMSCPQCRYDFSNDQPAFVPSGLRGGAANEHEQEQAPEEENLNWSVESSA
jgi:hypothetical protein